MAFSVEPLAELEDLEARLEFDLDDDKMRELGRSALEDATVLVREYGLASWTAATAPPIAITLTLKAAARFVINPMSLETARGADETNIWGETNSRGVYLEPDEIELLRQHRKTDNGFQAPRTYNYTKRFADVRPLGTKHYSPVTGYGDGQAKFFPDYTEGDVYAPYYPRDER